MSREQGSHCFKETPGRFDACGLLEARRRCGSTGKHQRRTFAFRVAEGSTASAIETVRVSTSVRARLAARRAFSRKEESSKKAQRSTKGWLAASKGLRRRAGAVRARMPSYIC